MSREFVQSICETLPGAEVSAAFGPGHATWKVGGKVFASIGALDDGVAVKTADADFAAMMIEAGDARRARYFHKSWIFLPWGTDEALIRDRVIISYDIIRASLTKKLQATLAPRVD